MLWHIYFSKSDLYLFLVFLRQPSPFPQESFPAFNGEILLSKLISLARRTQRAASMPSLFAYFWTFYKSLDFPIPRSLLTLLLVPVLAI